MHTGLRIFGFLGIAWLAGFVWFISAIERATPPDVTIRQSVERTGIVAVTGGGGTRIEAALDLLAKGKGVRVLVSGVAPGTRLTDLKDITPHLDPGLYDCCVDLGPKARTTLENALETEDWAQEQHFQTLWLVTTDYHMARAKAELQSRLPDAQIIPWPVPSQAVPEKGWMVSPVAWKILAVEYSKYLVARARMLIGWG